MRAESFGSLKTEEKTNASAGSESQRPSGRRNDAVCQFRGRFPSVTNTTLPVLPVAVQRRDLNHPADRSTASTHERDSRSGRRALTQIVSIDHFGGRSSRFLMESLILAQDERWRRA